MAVKVAINGYGRIGRNVLRALYEHKRTNEIQIVAINDLGDAETNAHLTQYDTAHGKFPGEVGVMAVTSSSTATKSKSSPNAIRPNCRGDARRRRGAGMHGPVHVEGKRPARISRAARRKSSSPHRATRMSTAPSSIGVNDDMLTSNTSHFQRVVHDELPSAAGQVLHDKIGIVHGLMTTIHAYTNDQVLTDVYHKDLRRARSATH